LKGHDFSRAAKLRDVLIELRDFIGPSLKLAMFTD